MRWGCLADPGALPDFINSPQLVHPPLYIFLLIFFLQNFEILVESSLIAHSIGNLNPKNVKTEHFWWKRHVTRYDVMSYFIGFPATKKGVWDPLFEGSKSEKFTFMTSEIESRLNFGLVTNILEFGVWMYQIISWKNKWN